MNVQEKEIVRQALNILENSLRKPGEQFSNPQQVKSFLRLKLLQSEKEIFSVMFLDQQNCLIEYKEMFFGTVNQAAVYPREIAKLALSLNSAAVIVAHNHPSGNSTPSEADKKITKHIKSALELFEIRVLDHIIVGYTEFSFAENDLI